MKKLLNLFNKWWRVVFYVVGIVFLLLGIVGVVDNTDADIAWLTTCTCIMIPRITDEIFAPFKENNDD